MRIQSNAFNAIRNLSGPVTPIRFKSLSATQKENVIYGGTFDPVHQGHVRMVEEVVSQLGATRVIVIPTGTPPHKQGRQIAAFKDRFAMIKAAFSHIREVVFSRIENRKKSTDAYTLGTLKTLFKVDDLQKVGFPVPFVIGADSLSSLPSWGGARDLAKNLVFVVFKREGDTIPKQVNIDGETIDLKIEPVNADVPNLSSTELREKIQQGATAKSLGPAIPEKAAEIIDRKKLYRPNSSRFKLSAATCVVS